MENYQNIEQTKEYQLAKTVESALNDYCFNPSCLLSAFLTVFHFSFPDAKMLENILKHHIICYLSSNIRDKENTFSYILGKEIA